MLPPFEEKKETGLEGARQPVSAMPLLQNEALI